MATSFFMAYLSGDNHLSTDHLLQQAAMDNADRRRWAIFSLVTLLKLQLLNDDNSKVLGEAIWHVVDENDLPKGTDFYKFAFLHLPHPNNVDPDCLFKRFVYAALFPIEKNKEDRGVGITGGDIPLVHEIIGANSNGGGIWTEEDAVEILRRLLEWWDADKERLRETEVVPTGFPSIQNEFRSRFSRMVELLAEVIGPKLSADSPDDIKTSLGRLLKEMQEYDLPVLKAEAACLHIYPEQIVAVCNQINEALTSNQDDTERDGLSAIAKIILDGRGAEARPFEHNPALMLSQYLTWSSTHAIDLALWIVVRILEKKPTSFSSSLEAATQKRLSRLFIETAYDSAKPDMTFDERLEIRRAAAHLAAKLWSHYKFHGLSVPVIVEKWRAACLSPDEFSEIRNAWEDCESA